MSLNKTDLEKVGETVTRNSMCEGHEQRMQGLASGSTRGPGVSAWGVSLMTGGQVPRPHGLQLRRIAHNSAMLFKAGK